MGWSVLSIEGGGELVGLSKRKDEVGDEAFVVEVRGPEIRKFSVDFGNRLIFRFVIKDDDI